MTIVDCVPVDHMAYWKIVVIVVVTGLVGAALILLAYCFCCRRISKPVRALRAVRKRALGMPKSGPMTVVVTDIEGYSSEGRGSAGAGIFGRVITLVSCVWCPACASARWGCPTLAP